MNRLTEDLVARRPSDPPPPFYTLGSLENYLGIARARDDAKRAAITGWLEHNTPEPTLLRQLRRKGYVDRPVDAAA